MEFIEYTSHSRLTFSIRTMTMTERRFTRISLSKVTECYGRNAQAAEISLHCVCVCVCCRLWIHVCLNRVGTMRANAIRFSIVTTSVFTAPANQASPVIVVKRTSTIAKALSVRKTTLSVSMESTLFIANVKRILNEVGARLCRWEQAESIFALLSRLGWIVCGTESL